MEAGIVALITTIGGIALVLLKLYTGPSAKERQKQKEKGKFDEALRKGDLQALSALLSNERDRVHKDSDNPVRQGVDALPR